MPETDIIDSTDRALGCQQCGQPLGGAVSDDSCGELCQQVWYAVRVGALLNKHDHAILMASQRMPARLTGDVPLQSVDDAVGGRRCRCLRCNLLRALKIYDDER